MTMITTRTDIPDELSEAVKSALLDVIEDVKHQTLDTQYPEYMSKKEAARYLNISLNTLTEWMSISAIPYTHIGKTYRFNRHKLDKFMTS